MLYLCLALGIALLGGLLYWLLIITEGTYLGTGVVIFLYDLVATRYDGIKKLVPAYESFFLGAPLVRALGGNPDPLVLDVASGTGRLAQALFAEPGFTGKVVGVDHSRRMLSEALRALRKRAGERLFLIVQDAAALGFQDAAFDCVTCLEALEFMGNPKRVIDEMVRVLKPGGVLLLSNRVGKDAWAFPGRMCGRGRLEGYLRQLGLEDVHGERWQVHYDLVWAYKPE